MPSFEAYLVDRNEDGFIDDASARILAIPATNIDQRAYWSRLLDLAADTGLRAQALPLPLIVSAPPDGDADLVSVRTIEDIEALGTGHGDQGADAADATNADSAGELSSDLLDFFSTSGLLEDRDGDLLPDATRFSISLPEEIPAPLGAALCNFAVRVGLETGGVTFPLAGDNAPAIQVRPTAGPAKLTAQQGGWLATGSSDDLAELFERIARDWPSFGLSETAGARAGIEYLAARLAGQRPPSADDVPVRWELQWAAQPETERLVEAVQREVLPRLTDESRLDLVVFVCEPLSIRRRLEQTLTSTLEERNAPRVSVTVLSAFKTGLSWLREVILPELQGADVHRLEVTYRRFEPEGDQKHLDMPIRWLQELFPGDEIAADALNLSLDDIVFSEDPSPDAPTYRATAFGADGRIIDEWELDVLSYSMPFMPNVAGSEFVEVTTGGFVAELDGERIAVPVDTDLDRFWKFWQDEALRRVLTDIRQSSGGFVAARQPFFGGLEVEVWLSSPNSRLGIREENDSAAEALHEDIYFNALDTIEVLGVSTTGDKTSAPGPVIPIVHVEDGVAPHAVVRLLGAPPPAPARPAISVGEISLQDGELLAGLVGPFDDLAEAVTRFVAAESEAGRTFAASLISNGERIDVRLPLPSILSGDVSDTGPPMNQNIHGDLVNEWSARVGRSDRVTAWIEGQSYQGRPIPVLAIRSAAPGRIWSPAKLSLLKPTAMIVARHHANEISSTNAAFQLAHLIEHDPDWTRLAAKLNIIVIPYENADGAALHARLAAPADAATWKHHPARYNALGHEFGEDYFEPDSPFGEARVRPAVWRRWLPDALVDNHGVPSHEWVQPFAGFGSPPRFRVSYWAPQALIYGIARFVDDPDFPEHRQAAIALRDAVAAAFQGTPIGELNQQIGASYRRWGQDRVPDRFPGRFYDGMLWHFGGTPVDPDGRGFNVRFPKTTVISWVTEVNDETATGSHLEMVAEAHLIANRAMLELLAVMDSDVRETSLVAGEDQTLRRYKRDRPLKRR